MQKAVKPVPEKKAAIPVSVARDYSAAGMGTPHRLTAPGGIVQSGGYLAKKHG